MLGGENHEEYRDVRIIYKSKKGEFSNRGGVENFYQSMTLDIYIII